MSAANVGKRCRWVRHASSAAGNPAPHEGEIVAYVPAGASMHHMHEPWHSALSPVRDVVRFDRYLVREDRTRKVYSKSRGHDVIPAKHRWYAPRCSAVEVLP